MNIPKAIEILEHYQGKIPALRNNEYKEALKLGIEAQKAIVEQRKGALLGKWQLLPGETED